MPGFKSGQNSRPIRRALSFLLLGAVLINVAAALLLQWPDYANDLSWNNIRQRIIRSRQHIANQVLILGDSVAGQIFPFHLLNNSLASNGAVLTVGQYILAVNALEQNSHIRYVILVSSPRVIGYGFFREQTYTYFIKPFYTPANFRHLSPLLRRKINARPLSRLALLPLVKAAPCFADLDFSLAESPDNNPLSDIAAEYLIRLREMARRHGATFLAVCPPIPERQARDQAWLERLRQQVNAVGLQDVFAYYFTRPVVLPDPEFHDDLHIERTFLRKNRPLLGRRLLPPQVWLCWKKQR